MVLDTRDIEDSATIFGFSVSTHKRSGALLLFLSKIGQIWRFFRFETTVYIKFGINITWPYLFSSFVQQNNSDKLNKDMPTTTL